MAPRYLASVRQVGVYTHSTVIAFSPKEHKVYSLLEP